MTAVDYILEGLARALEVERECGVRELEIDRRLVAARASAAVPSAAVPAEVEAAPVAAPSSVRPAPEPARTDARQVFGYVFLHDRRLSAGAVEIMAKIVTAMGQTADTAPIVFTGVRPQAKIYIVMGIGALGRWFPGLRAAPGSWLKGPAGEEVLFTASPEEFVRFGKMTDQVLKDKRAMWTSLKGAMQRMALK